MKILVFLCLFWLSINVYALDDPSVSLGEDQEVFYGTDVTLEATMVNMPECPHPYYYIWNLGGDPIKNESATMTISVTSASEYGVDVMCKGVSLAHDTVYISLKNPQVWVGEDRVAQEGSGVVLSGSITHAPCESYVYAWTQTSGTSVVLEQATGTSVTGLFEGTRFLVPHTSETLSFLLTVTPQSCLFEGQTFTDSLNIFPQIIEIPDTGTGSTDTGTGSTDTGTGEPLPIRHLGSTSSSLAQEQAKKIFLKENLDSLVLSLSGEVSSSYLHLTTQDVGAYGVLDYQFEFAHTNNFSGAEIYHTFLPSFRINPGLLRGGGEDFFRVRVCYTSACSRYSQTLAYTPPEDPINRYQTSQIGKTSLVSYATIRSEDWVLLARYGVHTPPSSIDFGDILRDPQVLLRFLKIHHSESQLQWDGLGLNHPLRR